MKNARITALLAILVMSVVLAAQSLELRLENGQIRFAAAQLRLFTGDPLRQLHDGASVVYVFKLTLRGERRGAAIAQSTYRFVTSYDLWEEKFSITEVEPARRSASRLSESAAQMWCIDALALPTSGVATDRPLWASLEYEAEDSGSDSSRDSGSPLGALVDIFSKRNPRQPVRGSRETGPFRLSQLR
jgi:hypothetical protein